MSHPTDQEIIDKTFQIEDILEMNKMYITRNPYSRPGKKLKKVKGLVVHWALAVMGTVRGMYNFFESRKTGNYDFGSAHYGCDVYGNTASYMPEKEMAYHVGAKAYTKEALENLSSYPNDCTIGVEMCNIDDDGNFNEKTLNRSEWIFAWLCYKYDLDPYKDIYRHYDIVAHRKVCPKLFVEKPEEYKKFKDEVNKKLKVILKQVERMKKSPNI